MRIAISGIGIAGPTLAYWLVDAGHQVLLIEEAPALRKGGYVVDFWGVGYDVAEKMGLIPRIKEVGYQVREVRFVDQRGRRTGGFGTEVFSRLTHGRFTSLRRSDLSGLIHGLLGERVESLFNESIVALDQHPDFVRIRFTSAPARDVDLVVGADGLHSAVRRMVFGAQSAFETSLGCHVAAFEVTGYRPRDELVYVSHTLPGRQVSRFSMREDKTLFLFMFRDEHLPAKGTIGVGDPRSTVREVFRHVGWECPEILTAMTTVPDIYFDRVSQIRLDRWTSGRTALVGDAGACVSLLAGEGTGLAMAEAFVLARAVRACGHDHAAAFARYEQCLMPFVRQKQVSAAKFASSFVPKTAFGISFRNVVTGLLGIPAVADFFVGRSLRDDFSITRCG